MIEEMVLLEEEASLFYAGKNCKRSSKDIALK